MDPNWAPPGSAPPGINFSQVRENSNTYPSNVVRDQRRERIMPYWGTLVADNEPRTTKDNLVQLMHDLKDEGNALFKECSYDLAWMHYRNALQVAKMLELRYYHEVDKEFVSTLFSNRAFCCLKKEMYEEAAQDCDVAIATYGENMKAYYRKVLSLKGLQRYEEALDAAEIGMVKLPSVFKDLVSELKGLAPQRYAPHSRRAEASIRKTCIALEDRPDEDWLEGTNVHVTELAQAATNSKMPRKKKAKSSAINERNDVGVVGQKHRPATTTTVSAKVESSSSDDDSLNEDEKFASNYLSVKGDVLGIRPPVFNNADEDLWSFHHTADGKGPNTGMGLDAFRPAGAKGATAGSAPVMGLDEFSPPVNKMREMEGSGGAFQTKTYNKHAPPQAAVTDHGKPLGVLSEQEQARVQFPMHKDYEFQLACRKCFVKVSEGVRGYQHTPAPNHVCMRDMLLVKRRSDVMPYWVKVRPRPEMQRFNFTGYRLCQQFLQGQTCRVGEDRCSFPHNPAELALWTMDKKGAFNIIQFIHAIRALRIDNSSMYESRLGISADDRKPAIPGLVYAKNKSKVAQRLDLNMTSPPLEPPHQARPPHTNQPFVNHGVIGQQVNVAAYQQQAHMIQAQTFTNTQYRAQHVPPPMGGMTGQFQQHPMSAPPLHQQSHSGYGGHVETQESPSVPTLENPLKDSHVFKVVCNQCFLSSGLPGDYRYSPHLQHKCDEDVLAVYANVDPLCWMRIRERKNHREFPGKYILCHSVYYNQPNLCKYGEDVCSFAHNEVEQRLWTMEKGDKFSVTEFIMQQRQASSTKGYTTLEVLKRRGGYFCFLCKPCFYQCQPTRISGQGTNSSLYCSGPNGHVWEKSKTLTHMGPEGITPINPRVFTHKTAFFKICKYLHFCRDWMLGKCKFAHSIVERDIWMLERDTGMTWQDIVDESRELRQSAAAQSSLSSAQSVANSPSSSGYSSRAPTPANAALSISSTTSQPSTGGMISPDMEEGVDDKSCPFVIQELCGLCWKNGAKSYKDGDKDRCNSTRHHTQWAHNRVCLLMPNNRLIRPLPRRIPTGLRFIVCQHIQNKNRCDYSLGGPCQFAHSQDEVNVWKWMVSNNVRSLDDLVAQSAIAQNTKAEVTKAKISGGQSVVSATKSHIVMPTDLVASSHYCHYCGKPCNSQKQWDEHCASEKHTFNVNSDKEHQWNYRQPPWGIPGGSYQLCNKHEDDRKCEYSTKPDMYNLCRYAHSQEELDEWRERYEWRQMKRDMARQEKVFSYMDQLLETYENAKFGYSVIAESMEGVEIRTEGEETLYREEKGTVYTWKFFVKTPTDLQLEKVALLHNKDRLNFVIGGKGLERHCQIAPGETFTTFDAQGQHSYCVEVQFSAGMFGSFGQWVIFDVGLDTVLVKKLCVEVGTRIDHQKVQQLREKLKFDRWTGENREVVGMKTYTTELDEYLKRQYKQPDSSESVITQASILQTLNRHNYIHKMHKLLELEEITQHQIISSPFRNRLVDTDGKEWSRMNHYSKPTFDQTLDYLEMFSQASTVLDIPHLKNYNMYTAIEMSNKVQEQECIYARPGELFARVPLNDELNEDTDAGMLILSSVRYVLLAPQGNSKKCVYEASIIPSEVGKGRDYVYLCLPPPCCSALGLQDGHQIDVEIQFQLDRLAFCEMHYAVDQLQNTDTVFPDISKIHPSWSGKHVLKISSQVLNDDQMAAVRHIVADRQGYSPPFVMYGPFGTGKTETLAQAAMVLLKERPETRILICTQTNNAADLYILRHLDPFLKKTLIEATLLRIYYASRRVNTVEPGVLQYCCLTPDKISFRIPSKEEILKHRICVVTLSTSLQLVFNGLKGEFTHIFVDEAAQALESDVIKPLTLADEKTCIVLSGDHIQLSPKVYSLEARELNFGQSLLERLFTFYDSHSNHIDQSSPLNILLSINYRSKKEILRYIAAVFYGGPEQLISRSDLPSVLEITPLTFYAVQGREVQEQDSTSYYNVAEVQEVVDRVAQLYAEWPQDWGEKQASSICVVSPYSDQVRQIRDSLRRKTELRGITVCRVRNVPGSEFRALFLSTVRTRHLIDTPRIQSAANRESGTDLRDFGFLSNPKLLNTALTRAQSLVAVVGDPVALCAIGECMTIWRTFLKHCQNLKSIYPKNITLENIKHLVGSLLDSSSGKNLVEYAEQSRGSSRFPQFVTSDVEGASGFNAGSGDQGRSTVWNSAPPLTLINNNSHERLGVARATLPQYTMENFLDDWDLDYMLEPDDIIRQLAKEVVRTEKLRELREKAMAEGRTPPDEAAVDLMEPLKIECIHLKEEEGHAVIYYNANWAQAIKKQKLLSANDAGKEYDTDSDKSDDEADDQLAYTDQQLRGLVTGQPDKYKRCVLHSDSRNMHANVLDHSSYVKELKISSRQRCGRAFNLDEVVVEVLPVQEDDKQSTQDVSLAAPVHGQVVGILKRSIDPKYHMFVCMVEPRNTGLMVPLNRGIPKIYNLSTKTRLQRARKGHVCVYKFTKNKEILFHKFVKVEPHSVNSQLFIVRYLKWDAKFYSPLGIVVGVVPAGSSIDLGMRILDIEYHIPKRFKEETEQAVQNLYPVGYQLPNSLFESRLDYRDKLTFTVDPPASEDLDDALSIEELPDGCYLVGVHISDVSQFVKRDGHLDADATMKGTSFYPLGREPVYMLPQQLSTGLCSLMPNNDRLTISIFLTVSRTGDVTKVQPKRCIINSKNQFSYSDTERIILDPIAHTDYVKSCVLVLYQIAQMWRRNRLGNAHLYHNLDNDSKMSPEAHLMMEEIMIMTNHQVAKLLMQYYPESTPLRRQLAPKAQALDEWKQAHAADAVNSVALTQPFLENYATCNCKMACKCIFGFIRSRDVKMTDKVDVLTSVWDAIVQAADLGNFPAVQELIVRAENHPRQLVALQHLFGRQERSEYICSGSVPAKESGHYSLNLTPYTHFTSPIRRYMDLAVHRMVAALIDSQPSPYSKMDIQALCARCTDANVVSSRYQQATYMLHLAAALKVKPVVMLPVVEDVNDAQINLCFPAVHDIPPRQRQVNVGLLGPCEKPQVDGENHAVTLKWQERIYEVPSDGVKKGLDSSENAVVLNSDRFISKLPAFDWQRLLSSIREGNHVKLQSVHNSVKDHIKDTWEDGEFGRDVTSEVLKGGKIVKHYCEFSTKIQRSTVLQAQLSSTLFKGMLTPVLQLVSITPKLDICLEHRREPALCFASPTIKSATQATYQDEIAYQNAWLPVLSMESAKCAVDEMESACIHNVGIEWEENRAGKQLMCHGKFKLSLSFCKERQIKFIADYLDKEADDDGMRSTTTMPEYFDYLCIRYGNLHLPEDPALPDSISVVVNNDQPVCWCCHCLVTAVVVDKDRDLLTIQVKLHESTVPIPVSLVHGRSKAPPCTVEWIPKPLPSRRVDKAIRKIDNASSLARDIALGRSPINNVDSRGLDKLQKMAVPTLKAPNSVQDQAVRCALKQPFTLIQGPPGTGKTVIGVRLAYLFAQHNKRLPIAESKVRCQVLYCGPSNKSVDVVANYLNNLGGSCPKLVRVYSERIERMEFPLPREPIPPKNRHSMVDAMTDDGLKDITLHHLIRQPGNMYADSITEYDLLFSMYPNDIADPQLEEYLTLVAQAEVAELSQAEIILCTCMASASPKMKRGTNIQQLIIDECGMCTEPESMVAIVNSSANQIVLIGDHKQLRPIVLNLTARNLGLECSLFERYSDKAIMLTKQYRMHEGIAQFPSTHFYEGKLECATSEQMSQSALNIWPNGRSSPVAFCHVIGLEETLTVATEEGSQQSKSNQKEASYAAMIASLLVKRYSVKESNVIVLTQYRAQCALIQRLLGEQGNREIGVNTVITSQGSEWDYVVLSTVRSLPLSQIEQRPTEGWKRRNMGFITDDHQINVAITRAKKGLIIIGNKHLLQCDPMWSKLITEYRREKKLVDVDDFMKLM